MSLRVDGALYPDEPPPETLGSLAARIDYISRLCAAWDFGTLPDSTTIIELRKPEWREAVDRCMFPTSPMYHLLRRWHGLPSVPFLGSVPAYIGEDPNLEYV
jgi:hypothetical protein